MRYKAVIFDMDGVLIDSEPGYNTSEKALFNSLGLPFGKRELDAITGSSGKEIGKQIKLWKPELPYTVDQLAKLYTDALLNSLRQNVKSLIPGAAEWISRLSAQGIYLSVGSSSTDDMVYHVVRTFGLDPLMDAVVTCDCVARGKPWPDIFIECARRMGVTPADCLVIEDSTNGVRAAHAAGMACAAFTGTDRHGLNLSEAELRFNAYDDLNFSRIFLE